MHYKWKLFDVIKSSLFIMWSPLWLYLCTRWKKGSGLMLFDRLDFDFSSRSHDDGYTSLFLILLYTLVLIWFTQSLNNKLNMVVKKELQPIFHAVLLTLLLLISSLFFDKYFDLVLKLGVIWCVGLIVWFLKYSLDEKTPSY